MFAILYSYVNAVVKKVTNGNKKVINSKNIINMSDISGFIELIQGLLITIISRIMSELEFSQKRIK